MSKPKFNFYRSAGGFVLRDGQFLLVHKVVNGEIRMPKGHIEPGEARATAAMREVREETGYAAVSVLADLGTQTAAHKLAAADRTQGDAVAGLERRGTAAIAVATGLQDKDAARPVLTEQRAPFGVAPDVKHATDAHQRRGVQIACQATVTRSQTRGRRRIVASGRAAGRSGGRGTGCRGSREAGRACRRRSGGVNRRANRGACVLRH